METGGCVKPVLGLCTQNDDDDDVRLIRVDLIQTDGCFFFVFFFNKNSLSAALVTWRAWRLDCIATGFIIIKENPNWYKETSSIYS